MTMSEAMESVAVYPSFSKVGKFKRSIVDNPYICEDDEGGIAFLSDEAKAIYLELRQSGERMYSARGGRCN